MMINFTEGNTIEIINSGPTGRFEYTLYLDFDECTRRIQEKSLELQYYFTGIGIYKTLYIYKKMKKRKIHLFLEKKNIM